MLKKAGIVAGVAAGLMTIGAPAFAGIVPTHDLAMHDGGDTQVTHFVPVLVADNHIPVSSQEASEGGVNTTASNIVGGHGGDFQESDYLPVSIVDNTLPISSVLDHEGGVNTNASTIKH